MQLRSGRVRIQTQEAGSGPHSATLPGQDEAGLADTRWGGEEPKKLWDGIQGTRGASFIKLALLAPLLHF